MSNPRVKLKGWNSPSTLLVRYGEKSAGASVFDIQDVVVVGEEPSEYSVDHQTANKLGPHRDKSFRLEIELHVC